MDFFKSVPGLLITLGIVLLIIALIILVVQSKKVKKANKKAAAGGEQPVPGNVPAQPSVQPAGMAPIADPTQPVQPQVDPNMGIAQETQLPGVAATDVAGVQPIAIDPNEVNEATANGFSNEVKVLPIDGTPVDASTGDVTTPSFEVPQQQVPAQPTPEAVAPIAPAPAEVQPVVEPTPIETAMPEVQPAPISPAVPEVAPAPVEAAPVTPAPAEVQPAAPTIYGGANPVAPAVEPQPVETQQIYGGADPLENTQPLPQVPSISSVPAQPVPAEAPAEVKVPEIQSVGQ